MSNIIESLVVDLARPTPKKVIYVRTKDLLSRKLIITVQMNGKTLSLDDLTYAEIIVTKPSGLQTANSMVQVGDTLQYTIRTQDIAEEGEAEANVRITFSSGERVTANAFYICVTAGVSDVPESVNEYNTLSDAINKINALDVNAVSKQIEKIEDEGTAQVEAIDAKGTKTLDSIPDDYTELSETVDELKTETQKKFMRPFKIVQISDTHYHNGKVYYHINNNQKMNRLVDALLEEQAKGNIDLIIHTGDITYENVYDGESTNYLKMFFDNVANRLPATLYPVKGNHDGFSDEIWKKSTGFPKQYTIEFNDIVFAVFDNFENTTSETGTYKGSDVDFLREVITLADGRYIVLCAHYFDRSLDSAEFTTLVDNTDNILFLMRGHTHKISSGTYGTKPMITGGHFAFGMNSGSIVTNFDEDLESEYGYVVYELTENGITVKKVYLDGPYYLNNTSYDQIEYSGNESELVSGLCSEQITAQDACNYRAAVDHGTNLNYTKQFGKYETRIFLEIGTDLNNVIEEGHYVCPTSALANTIDNKPDDISSGFILDIIAIGGTTGKYIVQNINFLNTEPNTWSRKYINGTWTTWTNGITNDDIDSITPYALRTGTEIANGDDLDNYISYGCYICRNASTAASIENTPYSYGGFKLIVERCTSTEDNTSNYLKQTIFTNNGSIYGYYRVKNNGVWSNWIKILTEIDAENLEYVPKPSESEVTDLDNLTYSGLYVYSNMCSNKPSTSGGTVFTLKFDANYITQLATCNNGKGLTKLYVRAKGNDGWGDWATIVDQTDSN